MSFRTTIRNPTGMLLRRIDITSGCFLFINEPFGFIMETFRWGCLVVYDVMPDCDPASRQVVMNLRYGYHIENC